ncbi:MAG: MogA/MoaB family molybdenum cofactor biosynthesis protein [Actinobacteria bacterium]|nr:MogA/MoaB family molybdenum cofactor biosynthesis protein [Actinomycetota bacterium]
MRIAIITVSDKGSRGERADTAGPAIREIMEAKGAEAVSYEIVPDEREVIEDRLRKLADECAADIIFTTGGTGFSPRDATPEATLAVIEREAPGIPEAMRAASLTITPHAMLSRAVAGIRKRTLIVNMPGSEKAVRESLAVIIPALPHAVEILTGEGGDCANQKIENNI